MAFKLSQRLRYKGLIAWVGGAAFLSSVVLG